MFITRQYLTPRTPVKNWCLSDSSERGPFLSSCHGPFSLSSSHTRKGRTLSLRLSLDFSEGVPLTVNSFRIVLPLPNLRFCPLSCKTPFLFPTPVLHFPNTSHGAHKLRDTSCLVHSLLLLLSSIVNNLWMAFGPRHDSCTTLNRVNKEGWWTSLWLNTFSKGLSASYNLSSTLTGSPVTRSSRVRLPSVYGKSLSTRGWDNRQRRICSYNGMTRTQSEQLQEKFTTRIITGRSRKPYHYTRVPALTYPSICLS